MSNLEFHLTQIISKDELGAQTQPIASMRIIEEF